MNIPAKMSELNLPTGSFIVVGSGILDTLGIRESGDIDMIISEKVYKRLEAEGWKHDNWSNQVVLKRDVFDLGRWWEGKTVDELLETAQVIDGIPYLGLEDVYQWKKAMGLEKDLRDVKLIDQFRLEQSNEKRILEP